MTVTRNKRIPAAAVIFLASVVFFAHTVIPHHHHGELICFNHSHCLNDECQRDGTKNPLSHQHDSGQQTDNCILKQEVQVPEINEGIQINVPENNFPDNFSYPDIYSLSGNCPLDIFQCKPEVIPIHKEPEKYPLTGFHCVIGLRAPPAA